MVATSASIGYFGSVAIDSVGNIYIADGNRQRVRKVDAMTGVIASIAGTGIAGYNGDGIQATSAKLNGPDFVVFDNLGYLYIGEGYDARIRKINLSTGVISTFIGTGVTGFSPDGSYADTTKISIGFFTFDHFGNMYLDDNRRIRKVNGAGIITTIAGSGISGCSGDGGLAIDATVNYCLGLCTDNFGNVYFMDSSESVRKIDVSTGIISRVAGTGDGVFSPYLGDGIAATNAHICPYGVATDNLGDLYITDPCNERIEIVNSSGNINTVAGTGIGGYSGDGGLATNAKINYPESIALDRCGNLYIADYANRVVRKVTNPLSSLTPSISISPSPNDTVCSGTSVTYTATTSGSGTTTTYQWLVNGTTVSTVGATYSYTPSNGDTIRCVISTSTPCTGIFTASSNTVHMVVNATVTPTISISPSPNDTICNGTLVTYTPTITGGGSSPSYQWKKNGANVSTSTTYAYSPSNGDSVRCILVSSAPCAVPTSVSSNSINMVVNPTVTPTITISASPNDTVCSGTSVTYSIASTGGGSSPAYQWRKNGVNVSTGSSYTYSPSNGDSVLCVLTSNAPCASPGTVGSTAIYMVVNSTVTPSISIAVSPNDTVCATDAMVSFTSTTAGGGTSPSYQWKKNGVNTVTSSTYTFTAVDLDSVRCVLISDAPCAFPSTLSSNTIQLVVDTVPSPSISISGPSVAPIGSVVTVNAVVAGMGSSYTIEWMNYGIIFAATTVPVVTYTKAISIDEITASIVATSGTCVDSNLSASILIKESTTSVNIQSVNLVQIYPNPASEVLNIRNLKTTATYQLLNGIGVEIQHGILKKENSTVDMESLPVGIYILVVSTDNGDRMVRKVIKS